MDIGEFEGSQAGPPAPVLALTLPAADFQAEWKRCDLLANYIGEYTGYEYPHREWAENLVSTVMNELLEAAVRLSPAEAPLQIQCGQAAGQLVLEAGHRVRPELIQPYAAFLTELCGAAAEARTIYFQLLTTAETAGLTFNQLGLAMLVHDFGARLAVRLEAAAGQAQTRVFLPTHELSV